MYCMDVWFAPWNRAWITRCSHSTDPGITRRRHGSGKFWWMPWKKNACVWIVRVPRFDSRADMRTRTHLLQTDDCHVRHMTVTSESFAICILSHRIIVTSESYPLCMIVTSHDCHMTVTPQDEPQDEPSYKLKTYFFNCNSFTSDSGDPRHEWLCIKWPITLHYKTVKPEALYVICMIVMSHDCHIRVLCSMHDCHVARLSHQIHVQYARLSRLKTVKPEALYAICMIVMSHDCPTKDFIYAICMIVTPNDSNNTANIY